MTLYGYARVSVREPEDKNLDLQVERCLDHQGQRPAVAHHFDNLGAGGSIRELTEWFEGLTEEQAKAVLTHAARMLEGDPLEGPRES